MEGSAEGRGMDPERERAFWLKADSHAGGVHRKEMDEVNRECWMNLGKRKRFRSKYFKTQAGLTGLTDVEKTEG